MESSHGSYDSKGKLNGMGLDGLDGLGELGNNIRNLD